MNYAVNNHHFNRYMRFIKSRGDNNGYVERHHIYPRSMFPQLADEPSNLIRLTAREHFIAHWMLHKAFGRKMTQAFMYMRAGSPNRYWSLNSRSFQKLREEFGRIWSKEKTGKKMTDATRKNMSVSKIGVQLSKMHRENIGIGNTGRNVSEETRLKISEAKKGITPNRPMTDSYRSLLQRPKEKSVCACCGKLVAINMLNRWHNDNCKEKEFA